MSVLDSLLMKKMRRDPAVEPSWIPFSEWNQESKEIYIRSAERNMDELQKELGNKTSRTNTLIAVNGTVIGLILAFMASSKIIEDGVSEWIGYTLIAGFCIIFISFVFTAWTSFESRESPVMDFWIGMNAEHLDLMNSPERLEEDFLNGFIQRCDDVKNTVERIAARTTIGGRIFTIGLMVLLFAIIFMIIS
ncbi:MAG: hypothetical protein LBG63_05205 [Candidatus Methanoplasma sp.]|jgi:hypothetical protein|nr:hypothetical protein [Candidatus Methanoplasma sp.]